HSSDIYGRGKQMGKISRKPLIIPISATALISVIVLSTLISILLIEIRIPQQVRTRLNIFREGNAFAGYVDIDIPYNITNHSPAVLEDNIINLTVTLASVQNVGWFPDVIIMRISERIPDIKQFGFIEGMLRINVSSLIAILAIADAYLVMDIEISSILQLGPLAVPFHYVYRIQDTWKAPYPLTTRKIHFLSIHTDD
ncbi:MAG: hypothetical protein ACFFD4_33180, partial [Candidatus Odinarchaeota archaeon]